MTILPTLPTKITSQKELDLFLSIKNPYTEFIAEKLKTVYPAEIVTQWHHILPKYAQGTDHKFNLIKLSYDDHRIAHELLYEVYKHEEDLLAVRFMTNDPLAHTAKIKLTHKASKLNQTGFYSSENQSIQGRKGGSVRSLAKDKKFAEKQNPVVTEFLKKNHTWVNTKTQQEIHINGGDFLLTRDLANFLIENTKSPLSSEEIEYPSRRENFSAMLAKVIKGQRKATLGWSIL